MCNPPFHDSEESAMKGNIRKTKNLKKGKQKAAAQFWRPAVGIMV
jgi:23S rRNA A1618 N6-methylase RlmF